MITSIILLLVATGLAIWVGVQQDTINENMRRMDALKTELQLSNHARARLDENLREFKLKLNEARMFVRTIMPKDYTTTYTVTLLELEHMRVSKDDFIKDRLVYMADDLARLVRQDNQINISTFEDQGTLRIIARLRLYPDAQHKYNESQNNNQQADAHVQAGIGDEVR